MSIAMEADPTVRRTTPVVALTLTAVAVWVCSLAAVEDTQLAVWVSLAGIVTTLEIGALWVRGGGFAPVMLPVGIINGLIAAGAVIYPDIQRYAAISAFLPTDPATMVEAIMIAVAFTAAVTVGGLLTVRRVGSRLREAPGALFEPSSGRMLALGLILLMCLALGRGDAIFYAPDYGVTTGIPALLIIGNALSPVATLALAVAGFQPGGARVVAWVALVCTALIHFAGSTRQLALMPGLILVAYMLSRGKKPRRLGPIKLAITAGATLWLSSLMLTLRGNPTGVGLGPLSRALMENDLGTFDWRSVVGNILFSTSLTAETAKRAIVEGAFAVSVNPLPGGATSWEVLSRQLRVNAHTPFSGLGELAALGTPYLIGYGLILGAVLGWAGSIAHRIPGTLGTVALVLTVALVALFSVTLMQYNLRSATRLIYYLLGAIIAVRVIGNRSDSTGRASLPLVHTDDERR